MFFYEWDFEFYILILMKLNIDLNKIFLKLTKSCNMANVNSNLTSLRFSLIKADELDDVSTNMLWLIWDGALPSLAVAISGYASWSLKSRDSLLRSLNAAAALPPEKHQTQKINQRCSRAGGVMPTNHSFTWPLVGHVAGCIQTQFADSVDRFCNLQSRCMKKKQVRNRVGVGH